MKPILMKVLIAMNRPESKLAAGCVVLVASVGLLLNLVMVSCEQAGSSAARSAGSGAVVAPVTPAPPLPPPVPVVTGRVDFSVSRITSEPEIRVRIGAGVERTSITIGVGGPVRVGAWGGAAGGAMTLRAPAEIRREMGSWVVATGGREVLRIPEGGGVAIEAEAPRAAAAVTVNGVTYPGRVRLVARSDISTRAMDIIEHVPLETYLPGVVAKEMFAGWPLAAYEVQAVCARTYAIHEQIRGAASRSSGSGSHYDVEASERDQAYLGTTSNLRAIEAVRNTRGVVLADGTQILRAYYSSTCGGRTASAADTWPAGPGFEFNRAVPLQARTREHACQDAPLYRWSLTRDKAELVSRLRTYGENGQLLVRKIRDIAAVEVMGVNADGRPRAFKVIEPGGAWYQLSGEQFRLACNQSVRAGRSADDATGPLMGSSAGIPAAVPDVDRKQRVASSDVEVNVPRVPGGRGAALWGPTVVINGRGFGHGVGMCQYCAKGFAQRGENWRTIVQRFYPGARLVNAYR